MNRRDAAAAAFLALAVTAAARQVADARAVGRRRVPPLGPGTRTLPPPATGRLALAAGRWVPAPPRRRGLRTLTAAWAAPLTVIGALLARAGGGRAAWDPELGCWIATGVGGPSGWLLGRLGLAANAMGHVVVCRTPHPSRRLLRHEAVHVRQAERLGPLLVPLYVWCNARYGYRDNPFERAARSAVDA